MVTPEDMKANAEYIHMADQHVDVPGFNMTFILLSLCLSVCLPHTLSLHLSLSPSLALSLSIFLSISLKQYFCLAPPVHR